MNPVRLSSSMSLKISPCLFTVFFLLFFWIAPLISLRKRDLSLTFKSVSQKNSYRNFKSSTAPCDSSSPRFPDKHKNMFNTDVNKGAAPPKNISKPSAKGFVQNRICIYRCWFEPTKMSGIWVFCPSWLWIFRCTALPIFWTLDAESHCS